MTTGADWIDQAKRLVDTFMAGAVPDADAVPDDTAVHSDTCRWCPLCQIVAVARGERPEVSAALADVLTATAGALRAFADGPAQHGAAPAPAGAKADDGDEDEAAEPGPVVQRIDIA
jgi:hypothetical protein